MTIRPEDWETPAARARVLTLARKLWNEDQWSCAWSDDNREHYIIRAAMEIALAPPSAEVVKYDDADALRIRAEAAEAMIDRLDNLVAKNEAAFQAAVLEWRLNKVTIDT